MPLLILYLLFLYPPSASADTLTIHSSIGEVTVFLSGAEIVREAKLTLESGTNHIAFADLPASLKQETIRLTTEADILIKALSKTHNTEAGNLYADELERLMRQKKQLQTGIQEQQTTMRVLEQKRGVLLANQDLSGEGEPLSIANLRQAMDYFEEAFSEIEQEKVAAKNQIKELQEKLKKIKKQLQQVQQKQQASSGVIEAVIQSPTAQQITVQLHYVIPNAYWRPAYAIRVHDINKPLNLSYQARIYQASGVDWQQVALTISSARPRSGSTLPDIDPVYIGFYSPSDPRIHASLDLKRFNRNKSATVQQEVAPAPAPIHTQFQRRQTTFSYVIEVPYTIPSGGSPKMVLIKNYSLPASYQYMTIPKVREKVYLAAKITDWENLHLLPGEAKLYLDHSYVGSTPLEMNAANDTLSLLLGNDESIVVSRTSIDAYTEKNFFGNKVTETKGWEITLRNTKEKPVAIKVIDQVPRSSNEAIEINLKESSGAAFDPATGRLSWNLELAAGQSKTLKFAYEIEYPDDKKIQSTVRSE